MEYRVMPVSENYWAVFCKVAYSPIMEYQGKEQVFWQQVSKSYAYRKWAIKKPVDLELKQLQCCEKGKAIHYTSGGRAKAPTKEVER